MRKYYKALNPKQYLWLYTIYKNFGYVALKEYLTYAVLGYTKYYNKWLKKHYPTDEDLNKQKSTKFKYYPKISIVVPTYNTPINFLVDMIKSVVGQTYNNWELCIADGSTNNFVMEYLENNYNKDKRIKYIKLTENKGISKNTNEAINISTGEYISFLDHDDILEKHTLYEVAKCLQENKHDLIYTDEDFVTNDLSTYRNPVFKPDWSPDLLLSHNYITHFVTVKKSLVDKVGGLNDKYDGAQDYDFLLRCAEKTKSIHHIPKVLYHWRENDNSVAGNADSKSYAYKSGLNALQDHLERAGINGHAETLKYSGFYTVKYDTPGNPLLSIIIPNKDHVSDLDKCLKSLYNISSYKYFEVIVVDNNSTQKDTYKFYEDIKLRYKNLRVLTYEDKFNFSKINNFAAKQAKGEYFLFLNNDTELIEKDSLAQMVGNCMRPDVGIVGAKLLFEDDTIQHVGVVLGFGGFAGHVFSGKEKDSEWYMRRPVLNCNYSAVTGACLLIDKDTFNIVDGFNEDFEVGLNDIDLCLKVRHADKLVVYNANAVWHHYESKSRGYEDTPEKKDRLNKEVKLFRKLWTQDLEKSDPYYSENLSTDFEPYKFFK